MNDVPGRCFVGENTGSEPDVSDECNTRPPEADSADSSAVMQSRCVGPDPQPFVTDPFALHLGAL